MRQIIRTDRAKADLLRIFDSNADYSIDYAERLLGELDRRISDLQTLPLIGRKRDDLAPGLYAYVIGDHTIFYSKHSGELIIERVLPQQMNITEILRGL